MWPLPCQVEIDVLIDKLVGDAPCRPQIPASKHPSSSRNQIKPVNPMGWRAFPFWAVVWFAPDLEPLLQVDGSHLQAKRALRAGQPWLGSRFGFVS